METPLAVNSTASRPTGRKPLPALSKWTVATLAAIILMLIWLQVVVIGGFSPPLALILGLPAAVVTVPIGATRWRWAPLLGVLYWIALVALNVPFIRQDLAHPEIF